MCSSGSHRPPECFLVESHEPPECVQVGSQGPQNMFSSDHQNLFNWVSWTTGMCSSGITGQAYRPSECLLDGSKSSVSTSPGLKTKGNCPYSLLLSKPLTSKKWPAVCVCDVYNASLLCKYRGLSLSVYTSGNSFCFQFVYLRFTTYKPLIRVCTTEIYLNDYRCTSTNAVRKESYVGSPARLTFVPSGYDEWNTKVCTTKVKLVEYCLVCHKDKARGIPSYVPQR